MFEKRSGEQRLTCEALWVVLDGKGEPIRNGLDRTLQGAVLLNSTQHCILEWKAVALRFAAKARSQPV